MRFDLNPMRIHFVPLKIFANKIGHDWHLIYQLVSREFHQRYRGTLFGALWSILTPLFMLGLFNFVFGTVFKARWPEQEVQGVPFITILFAGMITYGLFAEVIGRAPSVVVSQPNLVNKVIFPLEVLPLVALISGLINMLIPIVLLLALNLLLVGELSLSVLWLPIILLPYLIFILGLTYVISGLGVYLRDLSQIVSLLVSVALFAAPVFYPIVTVPEPYRSWLYLNPVTFIVEQMRNVLLFGQDPAWLGVGVYTALAVLICSLGITLFKKLRGGFADVL